MDITEDRKTINPKFRIAASLAFLCAGICATLVWVWGDDYASIIQPLALSVVAALVSYFMSGRSKFCNSPWQVVSVSIIVPLYSFMIFTFAQTFLNAFNNPSILIYSIISIPMLAIFKLLMTAYVVLPFSFVAASVCFFLRLRIEKSLLNDGISHNSQIRFSSGVLAISISLLLLVIWLISQLGLNPLSTRKYKLLSQLNGEGCQYTYDRPFFLSRKESSGYSKKERCKFRPFLSFASRWSRYEEYQCIPDAALCLAEMDTEASEVVPDIIAQIQKLPDIHNTGDGIIEIREPLVGSLDRYVNYPDVMPLLEKILSGDSSDRTKHVAAEIMGDFHDRLPNNSEASLLNIAEEKHTDNYLRVTAINSLMAMQSDKIEKVISEILTSPSKDYDILSRLVSALEKHPKYIQKLKPQLLQLISNISDSKLWEERLTMVSSGVGVDKIDKDRMSLARALIQLKVYLGPEFLNLEDKIPFDRGALGHSSEFKRWVIARDAKIVSISSNAKDFSERCKAIQLRVKPIHEHNPQKIKELAAQYLVPLDSPLLDLEQTYIAVEILSANLHDFHDKKNLVIALARDLIDTEKWVQRLMLASSKEEKEKIFIGRNLLTNYSPLSSVLWLLDFKDKRVLDAFPRNNNSAFKEWQDFGVAQGIDPKLLSNKPECDV